MARKERATLDTNVLISAYLSDGPARELVRLGRKKMMMIVSSDYIGDEFISRMKILDPEGEAYWRRLIEIVSKNAVMVSMSKVSRIPERIARRDPDDDMVVKTALAGKARFLLTYDDDILEMKAYKSVEFLRPGGFLRMLRKNVAL